MKRNDNYGTYSRYNYYDILYDPKYGYIIGLGFDNLPNFPAADNDTYYTIEAQYQYRPDLISLKFYGIQDLWWVIAKENNLQHPIKDIKAGKVIRIPAPSRVLTEV